MTNLTLCFCFNILLILLSSLLILILSVLLYFKTDINESLLEDISNNHNSKVIINFKYNDNCELEDRLISNGFFQGTTNGCKCENKLKSGSCETKDKYCYNVYRTSAFSLNKWRNKPVCLVRQNETYHTTVKYKELWKYSVPEGQECGEGLRSCGHLDSVKNVMCVDKFSACPVTKVSINDSGVLDDEELDNNTFDTTSNLELISNNTNEEGDESSTDNNTKNNSLNESTKRIKLDNDKYLVYSNESHFETDYAIPVEFKVFESKPCAFSNEYLRLNDGSYNLDDKTEYDYVNQCSNIYSKHLHENFNKPKLSVIGKVLEFIRKLYDFNNEEDYSSTINSIKISEKESKKSKDKSTKEEHKEEKDNKESNTNNSDTKENNNKISISPNKEENDDNKEEINSKESANNNTSSTSKTELTNKSSTFKGYHFDYRYKLLDIENKKVYYKDNNVLGIVQNLPNYPYKELSSIQMKLYSRSFIGIKKSCSSEFINPQIIDDFLIANERIYLKVLILISLTSLLLLITLITVCYYDKLLKYSIYLVLNFALIFGIYYLMNNHLVYSLDTKIYDCVDDLFAEVLGIIFENTNEIAMFMFKINVLIIILLSAFVIYTIVVGCLKRKGVVIFPNHGELEKLDENEFSRDREYRRVDGEDLY